MGKENKSPRAIGRYLIVETLAQEDNTTKSGVLLSSNDIKSQRHKRGVVVSVGNEVNAKLEQGDVIWFDKSNSFSLYLEGVQRTIILEHSIAVVEV